MLYRHRAWHRFALFTAASFVHTGPALVSTHVYRHRLAPGSSSSQSPWGKARSSLALPLLSGLALGLSFPPSPLFALAWGALVPLLLRWTTLSSAGRMLAEAYGAFGVACAVAFYWVLLHEVPSAALASLGGLVFFPLVLALPFAASLPLRQRWGIGPGFAALWAFYLTMEWGLSRGPLAFPWPLLGHTQATADPFRQIADLAGVPGLSAWVLALNGLGLAAIRTARFRTRALAALAGLLLLAGASWYGAQRLATAPVPTGHTRALLVQPAVPPEAWADVRRTARADTLLALSTAALDTTTAPVDLVVWPETALPALDDSAAQQTLYARLQDWSDAHDVALLAGAVEPAFTANRPARVYFNSAFLVRPDTLQRYRKNYLVPFAEHVPFSEYVPALHTLSVPAGGVAGYARGTRRPSLRLGDAFAGALICFESTFSHHARAYVSPAQTTQPVDFLVTLAQDGWWGRSPGYRQHFAFSQLRAIETRRAMAFVTVTGTTALIHPDGQVVRPLGWMERGVRYVTVPHVTVQSPYVRYGDGVSILALVLTVCLAVAGLLHSYILDTRPPGSTSYYTR